MDRFVARTTHDEGLASTHCHEFHPLWFLSLPWLPEIREFADVMDLHRSRTSTKFAKPYQQLLDQFVLSNSEGIGRAIYQ